MTTNDYQAALDVAVTAARAAGDILRADLHRPDGPRGGGDKADADEEAERTIRRLLLEACPRFGYLGEETGRQPAAPGEPHLWLVDPNDGTHSYLKGLRGSAVSIGLLRDTHPVLGVVFAFAAPDDEGDLITWAEGCGPIRRNGRPVERTPWPTQTGPNDIVLLSQGAQRKPEINTELISPSRFRVVPSIAYRLALVAAGDGVLAISLNGPGAWDYAGGHALLLAVGGTLLDQAAEPVTYTRDGESRTRFCFGGSPAFAAEAARLDWRRVQSAKRQPPQSLDLVRLERGQAIAETGLLSRAQGCLLGQLAGDSLGGLVEFEGPARIRSRYPDGPRRLADGGAWGTLAGQPTDDSEMALSLARAIVARGGYDREAAAAAYHAWYHSGPFDVGGTIGHALAAIGDDDLQVGRAAAACGAAASRSSQANGALMRISPLAIWGHRLPARDLAAYARADAALTHAHPICGDATAAFTVAAAYAIGSAASAAEVHRAALEWAEDAGAEPPVIEALRLATERPPADFTTQAGWVLVALQNAFFRLLHAPSVEAGVVDTVREGGDTDTNAAIAGALLGAVHGRDAIPHQWRQMLASCRPMSSMPGVRHPRPRFCWPVDAMDLAERLLRAAPPSV